LPKCPKCKKEITSLTAHSSVIETYDFNLIKREDGEYMANWDHIDTNPVDNNDDDFCCPECGEILFYDQEKAKEFLIQGSWEEKVC